MHGNLEPEEDWYRPTPKEHINDLWDDMDRLNALYEEMNWPENVSWTSFLTTRTIKSLLEIDLNMEDKLDLML